MNRKPNKIFRALLVFALVGLVFTWLIGGQLIQSANHEIPPPPADLPVETVRFYSYSGATLHGWLLAGERGRGAVILLHGSQGDRTKMTGRARFLWRAGYTVLLFDFQAHGESHGDRVTFGHLESLDASAAVNFIRQRAPGEKIGVIGASLGGAAALLATPPLAVNALVLESVYPTIEEAVQSRLALHLGSSGKHLAPLLLCQIRPRLGCEPADLHPIDRVGEITVPKFFIAGTADAKTPEKQSLALYFAAAEPKQIWMVEGAGHENLHQSATAEYEKRVLAFLEKNLR